MSSQMCCSLDKSNRQSTVDKSSDTADYNNGELDADMDAVCGNTWAATADTWTAWVVAMCSPELRRLSPFNGDTSWPPESDHCLPDWQTIIDQISIKSNIRLISIKMKWHRWHRFLCYKRSRSSASTAQSLYGWRWNCSSKRLHVDLHMQSKRNFSSG